MASQTKIERLDFQNENNLLRPLKARKAKTYFLSADLFHEKVTDEMRDKAFAVMALTQQHTYQNLTERPERMRGYFADMKNVEMSDYLEGSPFAPVVSRVMWQLLRLADDRQIKILLKSGDLLEMEPDVVWVKQWPLPNVWLGVSVEDRVAYAKRVLQLANTPAAVRFVSMEPLIGDLGDLMLDGIFENAYQWAIVGGESGHGARPCNIAWIRSIVGQCKAAEVPVFVKQLGKVPYGTPSDWSEINNRLCIALDVLESLPLNLKNKKGGDPSEWPENLRVREFPR